MSKPEEVKSWIKKVFDKFGRLDGAANVAGIAGGDGETVTTTIVSYIHCFREFVSQVEVIPPCQS